MAKGRRAIDLDGRWRFMPDLRNAGPEEKWYSPRFRDSQWRKVAVPQAWDTYAPEFRGYEGVAWFRRDFSLRSLPRIARLRFDGAGHAATVWLNGRLLGNHHGSYVPFSFDAAPALKLGRNLLAVRISHLFGPHTIPALDTDWWKYGGITRSVRLETSDLPVLRRSTVLVRGEPKSPWLMVPGEVQVPPGRSRPLWVRAYVQSPDSEKILAESTPLKIQPAAGQERCPFVLSFGGRNLPLWSPAKPRLLRITVELGTGRTRILDRRTRRFGVRTLHWEQGRLLLNGRPVWLRGVNQVEEYPDWTCSPGREVIRARLEDMKRGLNCNYFRAAHYPHHPVLPDLADEMGMMLPEEVPLCYTTEEAGTTEAGKEMLTELFWRDAHHPSVIMWSAGNERPTEEGPTARGVERLIAHMKSLDPSRPVTCVSNRGLRDKSLAAHDVLVLNEYFGVWGGTTPTTTHGLVASAAELSRELDRIHRLYPKKPVVIGEFGAPAFPVPGNVFGGERWQAEMIRRNVEVFARKPYIFGCCAWCYIDQLIGSYRKYPVGYLGSTQLEVFGLRAFNGRRRPAYRTLASFYRRVRPQT